VTNLVQALIGASYGFVEIEAVSALAKTLHAPESLAQRVHVQGMVFTTLRRRLPVLPSAEPQRLVALVDAIATSCQASIPEIVHELRRMVQLDGPSKAERIRDIIDHEYRTSLRTEYLARTVDLDAAAAAAAFERRFDMSIKDYLARRRVHEGLALIRAGVKIESAAREVGFKKGTRHFYAAVRKFTGTTPARASASPSS
jgi:AraC-like DNA-binding protein